MSHRIQEIHAELFGDAGNNAIVRIHGRQYPGVLIQGDSFNALLATAELICHHLAAGQLGDAATEATGLREALSEIRQHYELMLQRNGIELPYSK